MRTRRWYQCIVLMFVVPVALSFAHAQDENGLTIGFLPVGGESEWYTALDENVREEVIQRGFQLVYGENCAQDCHLYAFRLLVEKRVNAILLVPIVRTGWDDVLQEAQDAGIPVVIMDRFIDADESLYVTHVRLDFVHEGRLAAAWLAQATSRRCQIIELAGTEGSQAALERQSGFNDVLELFPGMVIIASQRGNFAQSGGRTAMETILVTIDPAEICAVWAHNDAMALGAIEVLKEVRIDPSKDILIVSIDATPDMLEALAEGEANATVELNYHLARPAFDALEDYFAGELVPKQILIQGNLVTQDTVAGYTGVD